ncbi:hypothetical protein PLICRDRAFT_43819 [Plicaturopsis crispa FD-325 SS-3]|nr:hypothetical protein PLICRDRAFT_43819 [Plicaturopsis crispa FD-325 SS-3]
MSGAWTPPSRTRVLVRPPRALTCLVLTLPLPLLNYDTRILATAGACPARVSASIPTKPFDMDMDILVFLERLRKLSLAAVRANCMVSQSRPRHGSRCSQLMVVCLAST